VTSRVETDDNANWTKESDTPSENRCDAALLTLPGDRPPPSPDVTSETTGSHVFSDIDYHVLRRHVMQGDLDDHVISGDRKSLDSRKLILAMLARYTSRRLVSVCLSVCHKSVFC